MIKNFDNFALDLIIESMILESKIEFSEKFLNILKQIKNNNISKELLLLKKNGTDADFPQNYIDTGSAKDEVTFITSRKYKEIMGDDTDMKYRVTQRDKYLTHNPRNNNIFKRLGYTPPNSDPYDPVGQIGTIKAEALSNMSSNVYVWFKCSDGESVINKTALVPYDDKSELLWTKNRNPIKVGRLVRSILKVAGSTFTEKDIEDFVNSYKSTYDIMENAFLKFGVVKKDKISFWYNVDNYEDISSTLGNSCMAEVRSDYFDIYTNNQNCSLVILYSDKDGSINNGKYKSNKIKGRALLWKTDQGDTFMDRIYTNNDSDVDLFKKYAYENGWWCRVIQNTSTNFTVSNGATTKNPKYTVSLEESKFTYYPYMDSVSFINFDENKLSNSADLITVQAQLCSTGGYMDPVRGFEPSWTEYYDD